MSKIPFFSDLRKQAKTLRSLSDFLKNKFKTGTNKEPYSRPKTLILIHLQMEDIRRHARGPVHIISVTKIVQKHKKVIHAKSSTCKQNSEK